MSALRRMGDGDVVGALAAASRGHDPYLANVLATEALNRVGQKTAVVEHMGDGLYVLDPSGCVTAANPAAERLLGRGRAELLGCDMHALTGCACLGTRDEALQECPVLETLRTGVTHQCDAVYSRPDGSRAVLGVTAAPVKRGGEVMSAVVVIRDVEERRRAGAIHERLAAIVQCSEDAILAKTPSGVITDWNPAAEAMFGYTPAEAIGRPVEALIVPPDLHEEERAFLAQIARGERVARRETRRMRKDGSILHVSLSLSPVRDASGAVVGVASIARDITPRKRAEQEITRLLERVKLAQGDLRESRP